MRIWHYKIIPHLPTSQLVAQWRELNSIFKKQDNHILINYVYNYPKENLFNYTMLVVAEMGKRKFKIKSWTNFNNYFGIKNDEPIIVDEQDLNKNPFEKDHNDRYLLQCFFNLQEKYDKGQKDYDTQRYADLEHYIELKFNKEVI